MNTNTYFGSLLFHIKYCINLLTFCIREYIDLAYLTLKKSLEHKVKPYAEQ